MSEEKPPEAPSAPLRPYLKKSERKGCVIAMLLGFAGLIVLGAAPWLFYLPFIVIYPLWPILLMLVIVLGGVCGGVWLGCKMRYKPPIAPPPLPRTQSEESSNQEEEKIQPGKEN